MFAERVRAKTGLDFKGDYFSLHQWSIDEPALFWQAVWEFTDVQGVPGERICDDPQRLPGCRWFPEGALNYEENLLRFDDDHEALVEIDEAE